MGHVLAFDLLQPYHEFPAFIVSLPTILIPAKIAVSSDETALFSLHVLVTDFEYHYSPDAHFTALPLLCTKSYFTKWLVEDS